MYPQLTRFRHLIAALALCLGMSLTFAVGTQAASAATPTLSQRYAATVLTALNRERTANHLPSLTMNSMLIKSAHAHNLTMARFNLMSHQLPGEAFFATRIQQAGYHWTYAGENVAWNSSISLDGLLYLQRVMYNEKAPNNGHRLNILSKSFRNVGIDVYIDNVHHKVWLTQDFGRTA